jgi:hypothetical protein
MSNFGCINSQLTILEIAFVRIISINRKKSSKIFKDFLKKSYGVLQNSDPSPKTMTSYVDGPYISISQAVIIRI